MREIEHSEIEAFHRDGAVLLKGVLSDEWLAKLDHCMDLAQQRADGRTAGMEDLLRIDHFPADSVPALRDFIEQSPIAECVGRVLNSPVRFYMDQLFYKPAGEVIHTPWHQDTCYYNVDGNDLIRAWVSPHAVPEDRGIEVVRGSHRWNVTYRPFVGRDPATDPVGAAEAEAKFQKQEPIIGAEAHDQLSYEQAFMDDSLPPLPDIESQRDSFDILGWNYEPGDLLLFHGHIVHSARGGVHASAPRRALATMWAGEDVHYLHRRGQVIPDPRALYDFNPKNGDSLARFPGVFPVVWPADAEK